MAAAPSQPSLSPQRAAADAEDSTMSSPLSEVEDKDGDPDEMDDITLQNQLSREDASDSDSNLSEANDTEAETERLFDTPQNPRHKDVLLENFNNEPKIVERTPTKTPTSKPLDTAPSNTNDSPLSDDDISPAISHHLEGSESPTKPPVSGDISPSDSSKRSTERRKRKRSPVAEQSDSELPLRKRPSSGSVPNKDPDTTRKPADGTTASATHSNAEGEKSEPGSRSNNNTGQVDSAAENDGPPRQPSVPKKMTRNGSRRKHLDADGIENGEQETGTEDDAGQKTDDHTAEEEEEVDTAGKNDEELEKKRVAMEEWGCIEERFVVFRDRLYKERLERLEREEESLNAEVPWHAEYVNMKRCVDSRYEERLRQINKEHEYVMQAHERLAVARRAQIWAQFYQAIREKREGVLSELDKDWYETQAARRNAHSVQDYALLLPSNPAQRTRNAVAYNTEVSILSGIAKHVGFPSVPAMKGATPSEIEDDLEAIKYARHQRQYSTTRHTGLSGPLDTAGEQFIQNTPWANPNHPNHQNPLRSIMYDGPPPPRRSPPLGPIRVLSEDLEMGRSTSSTGVRK